MVTGKAGSQRPEAGPEDASPPSFARRSPKARSDERKREILSQLFFEGEGRASYLWNFYILLTLSVVIAAAGLLADSTAVVIAAMLIAPLMLPILGTAAALVNLWAARFVEQFALVASGTVVAIGLSFLMAWVFGVPQEWSLPDEILARTRPGATDLLVALAAGFAGSYVLARREAVSAVAGVAIAVALVPPLSACGILLYLRAFDLAGAAFLLFATNFAAILFTASGVFIGNGLTPDFSNRLQKLRLGLGVVSAGVLVMSVSVPLILQTYREIRATHDRILATRAVETWLEEDFEIVELDLDGDGLLVSLIINVPFERRGESLLDLVPGDDDLETLQDLLTEQLGREVPVKAQAQVRYADAIHAGAGG